MRKKLIKRKKVTILNVLLKWTEQSFDEGIYIFIWVLTWSMLEPYVGELSVSMKLLLVFLLIIISQRDVFEVLRYKQKKRF